MAGIGMLNPKMLIKFAFIVIVLTFAVWILAAILGISIGGLILFAFDPQAFLMLTFAIILGIAGIYVVVKGIFPGMMRFVAAGALFVGAWVVYGLR